MILKQIPIVIGDLNKLGIALKSLDAMNIGTVGLNTGNIEDYQSAIKGLSAAQAVFALTTKGANATQIEEILTTETATLSKNRYTQADVQVALAKRGLATASTILTVEQQKEIINSGLLTSEKMSEIASTLGLTTAEGGSLVSKKALNVEMVKQQLESIGVVGATQAQILGMLGLATAEGGTIVATNLLSAAFAKLNRIINSNPWLFVIGTALSVIIGSYEIAKKQAEDAEKAIKSAHEEAEQALEESKNSFSEEKSTLQTVNSELETTIQKIKEISSISAPTLVEQRELNKLSTTNAQLEIQKTLLENNIKLKQKSAALNAKNLLDTQVEMEYSDILDGSSIVSHNESYSYKDHAKYQESNLHNAYSIYMKALTDGNAKKQQLARELIDASAGDSAVLTSELLEIVESFKYDDGTIIEGYEDLYSEYMGMIYNLQSLTNPDVFLNIAKSVTSNSGIDYEKAISDAYQLAYESNFDIDKLDHNFVKALSDAGINESTIITIFRLKEQEYQMLVDKINDKYQIVEIPDKFEPTRIDFWDAHGNIYHEYIDIDEETEKQLKHQLAETNTINERLNEYAKENPIEFQLVSSFDEDFVTLDKYIEEERIKAEKNTDNAGDYITNAIKRIYAEAKVQNSTSNTENPVSLFGQLTNSSESLNKFQSSVKSAADAYASLLSGNYSSTELLDSIQAINQAATDMGSSIDWELIDLKDIDSLDLLGNKLEEVSRQYAESILSGAGIDDSEFSQILTDIVSQMYKVEAEFTGMNAQLDRLQSSYQTLTGILESYNETGYVSLDNLQSLLTADENLIAMLEVENGQLVINQAAYENLVATQLLEFKAKLNDAAAAEIEALAKNKSEEATNNNAQASEDAVAKLDAETEAFNRNTSAAIANAMQKAEDAGVSEEEIQGVLNKYTKIWNAAMDNYSTDFPTFMNSAKSSASSAGEDAGKSAGEAFTDALDKELAALDKNLESGYINFNDYIQARLALIEDYYNQGKLSADEYYSYLEKHYDTQLSYMDKAVNAVTRRIDAELDALKQQKEDVENIYKVQIESLEEEKNLLEEANKERQRQKDLQKSLYDLERARNQRTRLVYSEDKGMHYVADDQSIRDAQENVDNAGYDIRIAEIDKSISKLEEARDKETNAIDEMISNLESYRDAWNDATSAYEEEQENLIAAQILGADWETDILKGRLDVLDAFKNQYIGIQQAMAAAAWESANEQVKAAKEAEKGASGSPSKAPNISGSNGKPSEDDNPQTPKTSGGGGGGLHSLGLGGNKLVYTNLQAYASGTNNAKKGLNLVGEGGPEAYFDNHGHVAIVTKPTLIPMEGGEVVKNERDTKKLLDPDNLTPVDTASVITPIQPGSFMWDLQEKFNAYISKMGKDVSSVMAPVDSIQKNMARTINGISPANNITNTGIHQVTIGDIHVTCPGVTSQEVARQVGVELNRQFSGFSLVALQESKK